MFGFGKKRETLETVVLETVDESEAETLDEGLGEYGSHCAWCGDEPDEYGSHSICSFHTEQILKQSAERAEARRRSR